MHKLGSDPHNDFGIPMFRRMRNWLLFGLIFSIQLTVVLYLILS
jgi:hypothetical protein